MDRYIRRHNHRHRHMIRMNQTTLMMTFHDLQILIILNKLAAVGMRIQRTETRKGAPVVIITRGCADFMKNIIPTHQHRHQEEDSQATIITAYTIVTIPPPKQNPRVQLISPWKN
jgi:hypothetical protein